MNLLNVKNLQVSYNDMVTLNNVSFNVKKGDYIVIAGKNGSGKSTLLKALVGLKKPSKGKIDINLPLNEISYLEQVNTKNNNYPITVYEVLLTGLQKPKKLFYDKADYEKVNNLLKQLDIESIKNKKLGEISGGQKQRVLIARSLAKNPKLLILDEPLSGLDSKISKEIYSILRNLNEKYNITIIMTSHDLKNIKENANRIILIDDGKILFDDLSEKWQGD